MEWLRLSLCSAGEDEDDEGLGDLEVSWTAASWGEVSETEESNTNSRSFCKSSWSSFICTKRVLIWCKIAIWSPISVTSHVKVGASVFGL